MSRQIQKCFLGKPLDNTIRLYVDTLEVYESADFKCPVTIQSLLVSGDIEIIGKVRVTSNASDAVTIETVTGNNTFVVNNSIPQVSIGEGTDFKVIGTAGDILFVDSSQELTTAVKLHITEPYNPLVIALEVNGLTSLGVLSAGSTTTANLSSLLIDCTGLIVLGNSTLTGVLSVIGNSSFVGNSFSVTSTSGVGSNTISGLTNIINGATQINGLFGVLSSPSEISVSPTDIYLDSPIISIRNTGVTKYSQSPILSSVENIDVEITASSTSGSSNSVTILAENTMGNSNVNLDAGTHVFSKIGGDIVIDVKGDRVDIAQDIQMENDAIISFVNPNGLNRIEFPSSLTEAFVLSGSDDFIIFNTATSQVEMNQSILMKGDSMIAFNNSSNRIQFPSALVEGLIFRDTTSQNFITLNSSTNAIEIDKDVDLELPYIIDIKTNRNTAGVEYVQLGAVTDIPKFIRFRRGGSGTNNQAGCMFSNFDSGHFYVFNNGSLQIAYNSSQNSLPSSSQISISQNQTTMNTGIITPFNSTSSSSYVVQDDDYIIEMTYTLGSASITLPSADVSGRKLIAIHNLSGGASTLTINPQLGDTIDGILSNLSFNDRFDRVSLTSNGNGIWYTGL